MDKTTICIINSVMSFFIILIVFGDILWRSLQDDECLKTIWDDYIHLIITQGVLTSPSIIIAWLGSYSVRWEYQFCVGVFNCVLAVLYAVPMSLMIRRCEIPNNDNNVLYLLANGTIVGVGAIGLIAAPFIALDYYSTSRKSLILQRDKCSYTERFLIQQV